MAYDKDRNYQDEINQAVAKGDYASASEQQRNEKIDAEGLSYDKTNKYTIPNGVSDEVYNNMMSEHKVSDDVLAKGENRNDAANRVNDVTNKDNIVSEGVYTTLNRQFETPLAVQQADRYLSEMLQKIQSGKTSYSDKLSEMMDTIMNREKFSYDVDTDPLFQQALASAMNSGKQAMQDTIGQASALTGGYGSTYATTAGNQAYNAYIEDAYDNLPEYYQMAMQAYQMEGDELYRQYGMLYDADASEYNRNLTAYDATYAHRNNLYNQAYNEFRDMKTDALNTANLQISEHNQLVNDAYTAYNVLANEEATAYERDYQDWMNGVNQAMQMAGMQQTDWWNQANQDFTASENQKNRDFQAAEAEKDRAFTATQNALNRSASKSGGGDGYALSTAEVNGMIKASQDAGGGEKGIDAAINYLRAIGKAPTTPEQTDIVYNALGIGNDTKIDWTNVTITKKTDTWNGVFNMAGLWGNIDSNDVYTVNGKDYYASEIRAAMEEAGVTKATIDKIITGINQLGENGTYKYNK